MNKKLLLTSFIALGFACPAMAEPTNTSSTFPDASQNEYMQEDYTYEGAATSTNMAGVYQDNATVYANAKYHNATYQLLAGKYLPANSETPIDCNQSGYYCEGDQNGVNYSSSAQGLTQCPTGYGNSETGASADTDCYRTCTNNDVAHSTGTVNGGVYYNGTNGDGTKTCEPTDCVNGWHVKQGLSLDASIAPSEVKYKSSTNDQNQSSVDTTGLEPGEFEAIFSYGTIHGKSLCSITSGSTNETGTPDTSVAGTNCWCQIDSFTSTNGTNSDLPGIWVFRSNYPGNHCADSCAGACKDFLSAPWGNDPDYRSVLLQTANTLASCAANTINISWDGATTTAVNANNAGSVTYGGDIRTPQSAIHVPGKVFDGWEFSTTAPQNPVTE